MNKEYAKILIPMIRKVIPNVIAQEIVGVQPMFQNTLTLSEKQIHGITYYCVEAQGLRWFEMEKWVRKTFGEPGDLWEKHNFVWPETPRWIMNNQKFWFRNEADRTMFLLKWS